MAKPDIALLLGGSPKGEDDEETSDDDGAEMAVKAFFKAGASQDWKKALSALKTALGDEDEEDAEPDEESEDESA
jgi:hypothetical protein